MDTRKPSPHTFTEEDWNTYSPAQLEEKGKDVAPADAYRASKTLAERAAWKFVEENKPKWDLVTLCPPLVLGPIEQQVGCFHSFPWMMRCSFAVSSYSASSDQLARFPQHFCLAVVRLDLRQEGRTGPNRTVSRYLLLTPWQIDADAVYNKTGKATKSMYETWQPLTCSVSPSRQPATTGSPSPSSLTLGKSALMKSQMMTRSRRPGLRSLLASPVPISLRIKMVCPRHHYPWKGDPAC